jgi:hypothetical protein
MTSTRPGTLVTVGFLIATLGVVAPRTSAAQALTKDECKCEANTAKAQAAFVNAKAKCLTKCQEFAISGKEPASDCTAPYAGITRACVDKAESKAVLAENKCKDCPECYAGGDCSTDAQTRTAGTEAQVDLLGPVVLCDDSASPDGLSKKEQICEKQTAFSLAKFAAAKSKCYQKCRLAECLGKVPAGSCTPPASDPKTQECITKAETVCTTTADAKCTDAPECYGGAAPSSFCSAVEAAVDSAYPTTYCGSPSGAFLR